MSRFLPFGLDARATLVYLTFAGSGPALTAIVIWSMQVIETFPGATAADRLDKYATLAMLIASALLIIVSALAMFVSIRAMKLKAGSVFDASISGDDPEVIRDGDQVTVKKDGE